MLKILKKKMWELNDIFIEYPKVFNRLMCNFILILGVVLAYYPVIKWFINLKIINAYPFHDIILDNFDKVHWGVVIIPIVLIIAALWDAADLYDQLKKRKGRR